MEELFFFGFLAIVLLCGPWIGLLLLRSRVRQRERQMDERFSHLTQRIYELESLFRHTPASARTSVQPERVPVAEMPPPAEIPIVEQSPIFEPIAESRVSAPPPPPFVDIPHSVTAEQQFEPAPVESRPSLVDRVRSLGSIEEILGKNWLNKLGVILLVIGVAFFLAYQLQTLGPAGKILVGFTVSVALLGSGIWFERNERYRILARAGIGGGWALVFFTTYAMYHVPAAHVLSSQAVDLVLMLAVAFAMVWHTLRYNSQVVTGLAFLLAYSTVFISRVNVYSLSAGAILAVGIVLITLRRCWFELEVFAILGSYLNHFFWSRPIIEPMNGHKRPFPEFFASAGILISYWLIYRVSYVLRKPANQREENISTVAALLNSVMLLAILKYQSVHPEWAFWALLVIGSVEMVLGQLPVTKRRRIAFTVLTTIGAILLVAAIPFRYSGARVSVLWVFEAEALVLLGLWTREVLFSRLGLLATLAAAAQMIAIDVSATFGRRMDGADLSADYRTGLLVLCVAGLILYVNAHYLNRRWPELLGHWIEQRLLRYASYSAAILIVAGLWMTFPEMWTAVVWGAFALGLAIAAKRWGIQDWAVQANVVAALALLRVLVLNFTSTLQYRHISLRLVTVGAVAILYYLTSRWTGFADRARLRRLPDAYTWTASTLLAVLMWYELQATSVALAWCLFGLLLFEIGVKRNTDSLRWQAYVALASSFLRMLFVNLNADPNPGELSARVYTIVPLAIAFFYVYMRRSEVRGTRWEGIVLAFQAWAGMITIASLVRFELPQNWVVTGWAAEALILFATAYLLKNRVFQQQALLLSAAVLFRSLFHNLYARGPQPWSTAAIAVAVSATVLFAGLWLAFTLREPSWPEWKGPRSLFTVLAARPEQLMFFIPLVIVTVLLAVEMRSGLITVSWGLEGVLVFLFALWVGERSFRISGLALLLLCVGKIVVIDVWGLNPRDRYVTFIIMGCALLLVSFLYTRHREAIKQYL
ncbi:MAG TPA: DUF2339 domain-containing protein [Terriglobales bacterium]|nr:DUF2339 domain-containing protein [Terriglobales bacterium]